MWASMSPFVGNCWRGRQGADRAAAALARTSRGLSWAVILCGAVLVTTAAPATAFEPAREFLEALRQREYFEEALDYLNTLPTNESVSASFKEAIGYERGLTLLHGAKRQRDQALRARDLRMAQFAFEEFVEQLPAHALAGSAKCELGNVIVERARLKLEQSKRGDEPQSVRLRAEATQLYGESHQHFTKLAGELDAILKRLPVGLDRKTNPRLAELREQTRTDYLRAVLLAAGVLEEKADSLIPGSEEYRQTLAAAAGEYGEIYTKYRQRLAGLYARMYQGRTFQKVRSYQQALDCYTELLDYPDEPREFHELRTKALLLAANCWMDDSQRKYEEVIDRGGRWLEKAYPTESPGREMMELRLLVANASLAHAKSLRQADRNDPQIAPLLANSRALALVVTQGPLEFQEDAKLLLAKLDELATGPVEQAASAGDAPTMGGVASGRRLCRVAAWRRSSCGRLTRGRWFGGRFSLR